MKRTDNAVELWAEEFSKKPIRPLTKEEMSGLIGWRIVNSNKSFDDNELKKILEDKKGGLASVFYLRVKYRHTYEVSPVLAAYLGDNILKNFGMSTMMAIKVRNLSQNNGYLARIEEVSEKDVDPDWREDVEELKKLKYEKCN